MNKKLKCPKTNPCACQITRCRAPRQCLGISMCLEEKDLKSIPVLFRIVIYIKRIILFLNFNKFKNFKHFP